MESAGDLRQPLRVVLDTRLRTPPRARLLSLPGDTLFVCGEGAPAETELELRGAGADVLRLPQLGGRIDLPALLVALADRGMNEILIEAGATLAGSALLAGLVDELVVYLAPQLLGHAARALVNLPGLERLDERIELQFGDVRRVGPDLRVTLIPALRSENG